MTLRGNRKLLLNAGSNQPRIHLTTLTRENPAAPPMFCMLLRKHLSGGYITALEQAGLDRVVVLTIRAMDELGVAGERRLVLECMGRNANLILLDADGRIIDCLRRVDLEMSQQRQILPGLFYHLPAVPDKADPLAIEPDAFHTLLEQADPEKADRSVAAGHILWTFPAGMSGDGFPELRQHRYTFFLAGWERTAASCRHVFSLAGIRKGKSLYTISVKERSQAIRFFLYSNFTVWCRRGGRGIRYLFPTAGYLL